MRVYISEAQISDKILQLFSETRHRPMMVDVLESLIEEHSYRTDSPNHNIADRILSESPDFFLDERKKLCWEVDTDNVRSHLLGLEENPDAGWSKGYPSHMFMNSVFYMEKSELHVEDRYFEFNYVYCGCCDFFFEKTKRELGAGDMLIISPKANHNVKIKDDSTFLIQFYLNYNTFYSAFVSLLSDDNILSNFFRAILLNKDQANYLLLQTGDSAQIKRLARMMYLEYFRYDSYAPNCTDEWMRLLFAYVLRDAARNYSFISPSEGVDFAPIVKYLNTNYRSASLSDVAEHFHYSISYLSIMIKKLTGKNFTDLIRELKMTDAAHYLTTTTKSIEEIATLTGYNSSDQFTRTFREYYGITPSKYRKRA
ncbi:MAG: helix-turn-helix transcriptional regulator [Butyrivibrio sp.]|uniref:helix-turn-helix transcriptional regulator n=1 Tax=Butyrivibrio sp. TaxID=28121 RepID=UPI001B583D16|nr:helix-turn-helix transcriptional regulator [Butyrivibrio sp.]MBP3783782.1 helix-turn-helix transcriptional regulator [Butyrivibrio sp.]